MPERVMPSAKKLNAKWLDLPDDEWSWEKNRQFLHRNMKKVRKGEMRMYDIGFERGRYHGPNAIYSREVRLLERNGFKRVFAGRSITAENGKRFKLYEWVAK